MRYLVFFLLIIVAVGWFYRGESYDEGLLLMLEPPAGSDLEPSPGIEEVSWKGEFSAEDIPVDGAITVLDVYNQACPACRQLSRQYAGLLDARPDVAVRRVRMPNTWDPLWAQETLGLDVRSTPHIVIYDAFGSVIAADEGRDKNALQLLWQWMLSEQANK